MWAEEETIESNFTNSSLDVGENELEWTGTNINSFETSGNARGVQSSKNTTAMVFTSDATQTASLGTIKKIVVTASANANRTMTVTVGGETFDDSQIVQNGTAYANTDYEFEGSKTGTIVVTIEGATKNSTCWIKKIVVTYETSSSDPTPTISVDPTSLSLSGFTYIEGNGPSTTKTFSVSGSDLTANIGLSLGDNSNYEMSTAENGTYTNSLSLTQSSGSVAATDIYVRLKSGLTKAANYAGTITLSSTDAESVEVSLSGSVTGQIYDVNVATGLTGGSIGADPTSAEAGETISLTATPNAEYTFGSWSVYKHGDQSTTVTVTNNQFTMPAYDVDVTATFTAKPKHTATFSVNGVTSSQMYAEDADITFPSNPADINGKSFVGWATATISGTTNTAPSPLVTSATMGTSDITFYAVFANVSGSAASLTKMVKGDTFAANDKVVVVAVYVVNETTTNYGMYQETQSNSYVKNYAFTESVESVAADNKNWWTVTAGSDGKWKLGDSTNGYLYNSSSNNLSVDTGNATEWSLVDNEDGTFKLDGGRYVSCRSDLNADNKFLFRMAGSNPAGVYNLNIYKYVASGIAYSNYCTTVLSEVEVTITANKYATFSSDYKLDFSNTGVKAYKATTNTNSSVHLEEVTVVPANTGVLLYSETADDYTIPVSTETASNMSGNKLVSTANGAHNVTAEEYEKAYVFGKLNDEVGFFKAAVGKTVAQGRCYLLLDEAISLSQDAPFLSIIFDEGATTKINLNDNDNLNFDQNAPRYNMAGQRVSDSYKGIVIVNGKKYINK